MKKLISLGAICIILFSCKKENVSFPKSNTPVSQSFTKYTIQQGQHYSDQNAISSVKYSELKFVARFDSTAIYKTVISDNQYDINKLYGFSDNEAQHHQFSARFGWRWSDNALRLFAYVYNKGVRDSKELGKVAIGFENSCSIKVTAKSYVFTLNGTVDSLPRASTTAQGSGYKLYPYFGGDETAPKSINIWIREL